MKDLFVQTADMDAKMFICSILQKHKAIGIRPITFAIEAHPLHDSGMIKSGTELSRLKKGKYSKIILIWDHEGSGREHKYQAQEIEDQLRQELDDITWSTNNDAIALVPELESWLWHCKPSIAHHYSLDIQSLDKLIEDAAKQLGMAPDKAMIEKPKELFEFLVRDGIGRTISPKDFQMIGQYAGINNLEASETFLKLRTTLRSWFPVEETR
jgi:hypothetical protein